MSKPLSPEVKKVILAGVIGNTLEWYDFTLFAFFATTIAPQFFPADHPTLSLMATFAAFAAGFLMRPIGAILFGRMGDQLGRKKALMLAVALMAIPSCLMGLLPTYQQIGLLAPLFMTLLRLMQGVSVGGEYTGSISYLVEYAPEGRRGYMVAWSVIGGKLGMLLGTSSGLVMSHICSPASLASWGWRIPFILGTFLGFVGYFLRHSIGESPAYRYIKANNIIVKAPFSEAVRCFWKEMCLTVFICLHFTVALYMFFVYMPTYLSQHLHIPEQQGLQINMVGLFITALAVPVGGMLTDRFGRLPFLLSSSLSITVLTVPGFFLISGGVIGHIYLVVVSFALIYGIGHAAVMASFVELFPTRVRYTALSVAYNVATGIFGGLTPLICTALITYTGHPLAPMWWLLGAGIAALLAASQLRETFQRKLAH